MQGYGNRYKPRQSSASQGNLMQRQGNLMQDQGDPMLLLVFLLTQFDM